MVNPKLPTLFNNQLPENKDFLDLFNELEELDSFAMKMTELASNMSALLSHEDKSRSEICNHLGWSKGRMSYFLQGKTNPTFKSIYEFSKALGYEPDLVFRKENEMRAYQPWQKKYFNTAWCYGERRSNANHCLNLEKSSPLFAIQFHKTIDIVDAFIEGKQKAAYFSLEINEHHNLNLIPPAPLTNLINQQVTIPALPKEKANLGETYGQNTI